MSILIEPAMPAVHKWLLGVVQFLFSLSWFTYVIYLGDLLEAVG